MFGVYIECNTYHDGVFSQVLELLNLETLEQVEQFKYLGSVFVREGVCKEDVKTKC